MAENGFTLVHVTHEAVEQIGGIGTVLQGLIASPSYQKRVKRTILVGPTSTQMAVEPEARLGENGEVLYSSIDKVDRTGIGGKFRPVEWAFNVAIVYGKRRYVDMVDETDGEAEVLLVDVFQPNRDRLSRFKFRLWERFGLDSGRYDASWDYEEYTRLAEPALYALQALLNADDVPCMLFSHEFMGMPAALGAILEAPQIFRTIFHGHECATARRIVEEHPGHDTMFYNVLEQAMAEGRYVQDVFGDRSGLLRHALVSRSHLCDAVLAVGDRTRDELKFLGERFNKKPVDIVYNGVPSQPVTMQQKLDSRKMLVDYSKALVGHKPTWLLTHVTRPVISKGLWRDERLCHELDWRLAERGETAVLYILTSGGGVRRAQDIVQMEQEYGWPRHHRSGYPDLVGPEEGINDAIEAFNAEHDAVQIVLVNQFGWSPARIGQRLPANMTFSDLRRATDVELGMATYEPFGISPLEPLGSGAICVISNVCGCEGFVEHVTRGRGTPNVLVADFTKLDHPMSIDALLAMDQHQRDHVESRVCGELAEQLVERLPRTNRQREKLIESGQKLVGKMGWSEVFDEQLLPVLERVAALPLTDSQPDTSWTKSPNGRR